MSWRERITRIATTSLLSFLFSVALLSIEWPNSTHRGAFSAWCNHLSLLLILLALMTILFSVLDAAAMAARLVSRLNALGEKPILEVADAASLLKQLPGAAEVIRLYHLFKLAEGVGTAANRWDHLPVIAILLVIPSRARVFDALALPIVYAFLLGVATLLAVLCTYNLRKKAGALRQRIIAVLDDKIAGYSLEAECAAQVADGSTDARSKLADGDDWPARIKAMHIQTLKERILASHEGPFALFTEDSIVRALLLLLGGSGAITTVQFLFLSGR